MTVEEISGAVQLNPSSRDPLQDITVAQLAKKLTVFMKIEGSLPYAQDPGHYPQSNKSIPHPHT
jgi:hypothetical protein